VLIAEAMAGPPSPPAVPLPPVTAPGVPSVPFAPGAPVSVSVKALAAGARAMSKLAQRASNKYGERIKKHAAGVFLSAFIDLFLGVGSSLLEKPEKTVNT
jgi:hypothetical protein